jgi:AcrR family transcriptional regulator
LLAEAERTLREQGIGELSLRDLARQAGVSHGAPRRHFADRQALLDALAEAGFLRLGDELRAAIEAAGDDYEAQLRATATAYIRFATQDAALLELMYTVKRGQHSAALDDASGRLFTAFDGLIRHGQQAGKLQPGAPDRVRLLLVAAMQGIAALVTSGSVEAGQTDGLIADTVALFAHGPR